jgi:hypothetical protein
MSFTDYLLPILDWIWLLCIALLTIPVILSNRKWTYILGAIMIFFSYLFLLRENVISFEEVQWLRWLSRFGVALIMYELAIHSKLISPLERTKKIVRAVMLKTKWRDKV